MDHLLHAPMQNILALAGLVFLTVAVLGKTGGLIAKLVGPWEGDMASRSLAGFLGLALVAGGVRLHMRWDQAHPRTPATGSSAGNSVAQTALPANK